MNQIIKTEEIVNNTNFLEKIYDDLNQRFPEELELAQGRSNFQIEKFIALNNFTISSCYKHCLKNAMLMRRELFRVIKEGIEKQREFDYKWRGRDRTSSIEWKTEQGGIKHCWFDLDEFEYKVYMNDLSISIKDKMQQLSFFDEILDALIKHNNGPITKEQFDNEEPEYWNRRLSKQISDELISKKTGIHTGNIDSMRNAAAPTIIDSSKNYVSGIPNIDNLLNNADHLFIEHANKELFKTYLDLSAGFKTHVLSEPQQPLTPELTINHPTSALDNEADDFLKSLGITSNKQ